MQATLESKRYTPAKTAEWTDIIGNKILDRMRSIAPLFKYVVTIVIIQVGFQSNLMRLSVSYILL